MASDGTRHRAAPAASRAGSDLDLAAIYVAPALCNVSYVHNERGPLERRFKKLRDAFCEAEDANGGGDARKLRWGPSNANQKSSPQVPRTDCRIAEYGRLTGLYDTEWWQEISRPFGGQWLSKSQLRTSRQPAASEARCLRLECATEKIETPDFKWDHSNQEGYDIRFRTRVISAQHSQATFKLLQPLRRGTRTKKCYTDLSACRRRRLGCRLD